MDPSWVVNFLRFRFFLQERSSFSLNINLGVASLVQSTWLGLKKNTSLLHWDRCKGSFWWIYFLGGGNSKRFEMFTLSWRNDPIWRTRIFLSSGWLNHQLVCIQQKYEPRGFDLWQRFEAANRSKFGPWVRPFNSWCTRSINFGVDTFDLSNLSSRRLGTNLKKISHLIVANVLRSNRRLLTPRLI